MLRKTLGALLLCFIGILNAATLEPGKQYTLIEPPILVNTTDNQVEVIEFFSYGCPHCASLEPAFTAWAAKQPKNVIVKKVPVEFNPTWESYAKLYYTAQTLNIADKMSPIIFDAVKKGTDLKNEDEAAKLFATQGIDASTFKSTYNSFTVNTALNQGRFLSKQYKIAKVPTVIVDGRYETNMSSAGGPQGLVTVLDDLVAKASELRKTSTPATAGTPVAVK